MVRIIFQNYIVSEVFAAVSVQANMLFKGYAINSLQLLEVQELTDKLVRQASKISITALLT